MDTLNNACQDLLEERRSPLAEVNASSNETSLERVVLCNLQPFEDFYHPVHGWLAMLVCVLGTLFNLANILVLTHRDMRSPVNMILTGIAVADFLVMLEYIPFTIYMNLLDTEKRSPEEEYSLGWGIFMVFHTNFTVMIHTVATWLTFSLAIWRFIMIKFPSEAATLCTVARCKIVLFLGFVVPFFLTIPNMLFFTLSPSLRVNRESGLCYTEYRLIIDNRGLDSWGLDPFTLNLWLYSILLKLVPCLVLTIFTACLIHAMYQAAENAAKLRGGREGKKSKQNNSTEKTTKLLIVIVILFLVAEFPMGILAMLSAILGQQFFMECYYPLGEVMDLLALGNSAANFVLYCIMSTQFRKTIRKMLGVEKRTSTSTSVTVTTKLERTNAPKKEVVVELIER